MSRGGRGVGTEEGFLVVFLGSGRLLPGSAILSVFPRCRERRMCDWEVSPVQRRQMEVNKTILRDESSYSELSELHDSLQPLPIILAFLPATNCLVHKTKITGRYCREMKV